MTSYETNVKIGFNKDKEGLYTDTVTAKFNNENETESKQITIKINKYQKNLGVQNPDFKKKFKKCSTILTLNKDDLKKLKDLVNNLYYNINK